MAGHFLGLISLHQQLFTAFIWTGVVESRFHRTSSCRYTYFKAGFNYTLFLAVVKKISCKSVARNSPFASGGSSKFGIKCAGNFPRTTQQATLEVIL